MKVHPGHQLAGLGCVGLLQHLLVHRRLQPVGIVSSIKPLLKLVASLNCSQSGELAASSFYKRWRPESLENEAASTSVCHWPIGRLRNSNALQHFSHGMQHSRILHGARGEQCTVYVVRAGLLRLRLSWNVNSHVQQKERCEDGLSCHWLRHVTIIQL